MTGLAAVRSAMLAVALTGAVLGGGLTQAATLDLAALGLARDGIVATTDMGSVAVGEDPGAPGVLQFFASDPLFELTVNSFDLTDPASTIFAVFGPDFDLDELSGDTATAVGTDDATGLVQFLFMGVLGTGAYAPFDGAAVLVEILAAGLLPFADGFIADGTTTLTFTVLRTNDPAVIPLPAGLSLLLAGLGALAVVRRSRHQAHS